MPLGKKIIPLIFQVNRIFLIVCLLLIHEFLLRRLGFQLFGRFFFGFRLSRFFGFLFPGGLRIQLFFHRGLSFQRFFLACPEIERRSQVPRFFIRLGRPFQISAFFLLGSELDEVIHIHVIPGFLKPLVNVAFSRIARILRKFSRCQIKLLSFLIFLLSHSLVRQNDLFRQLNILVSFLAFLFFIQIPREALRGPVFLRRFFIIVISEIGFSAFHCLREIFLFLHPAFMAQEQAKADTSRQKDDRDRDHEDLAYGRFLFRRVKDFIHKGYRQGIIVDGMFFLAAEDDILRLI